MWAGSQVLAGSPLELFAVGRKAVRQALACQSGFDGTGRVVGCEFALAGMVRIDGGLGGGAAVRPFRPLPWLTDQPRSDEVPSGPSCQLPSTWEQQDLLTKSSESQRVDEAAQHVDRR